MVQDIQLIDYDLVIENGDFNFIESEQQETDLLLNTFIGNWKQYPLVGIGILNYLAGPISSNQLETLIKEQMIADGFTVQSIDVKGSTLDSIKINVLAHR
jgi:hypothetical protein